MAKPIMAILHLLAGMMLLGSVSAQQTPASAQPSQPASGQSKTSSAASPSKSGTKAPASGTAGAKTATGFTLKTKKEKDSYALGMSIGSGLHRQGVPVDPAIVARGLRDAMSGRKTLLTEDEMKNTLQQLSGEVRKAQETKTHAEADTNKKAGEAFLAENKAKPGIVTLPDGLQYKILKEGTGPKPTANDTVTVNYRGTLVNGTEFDSSYKRGEPATFPVSGVIRGWTEALQLMPVGSKWQLFIPADLAYGDAGRPGIAPGDMLIFEVELLSIGEQKKDEKQDQKQDEKK